MARDRVRAGVYRAAGNPPDCGVPMAESTSPHLPSVWRSRFDVFVAVSMLIAAVLVSSVAVRSHLARDRPPAEARSKPQLPSDPVTLVGAAVNGAANAQIAMVIYSDFQCPYCGHFARELLPSIQAEFVDTGLVRVAFRHYPLEKIHSRALAAAVAAHCAGVQGQFWAMHDFLFRLPLDLGPERIQVGAQRIALEQKTFQECLSGDAEKAVRQDVTDAAALGVRATPTVFIGKALPDNRVKVTERFSGAPPATVLRQALQTALKSQSD